MKILDWCFVTIYTGTLDRGSRIERAHFGLWFSSSFVWVAIFYSILALLEVRIGKFLFLPIFLLIFALNYFALHRTYIKGKRGREAIGKLSEITRGYLIFSRLFVFLSIFMTMAIMVIAIVYYGKNIHFL